MSKYIEPYMLMVLGILVFNYRFSDISEIIISLCALIVVSLLLIVKNEKLQLIVILLAAVLTCFFPKALPFFPAIIYFGIISKEFWPSLGISIIPLVVSTTVPECSPLSLILMCAFSAYLAYNALVFHKLNEKTKNLRDSAVEREMILGQKNKQLLEMQQNQVHVATLTERNRIAREIHDNVGHQLSRGILQLGAIIAVTGDEQIKPLLVSLKETLDDAMNNIRSSVHDLHDESIDLESSIKDLCTDFSFCPVELHCETSALVPKDVKYCFITITKEALTNIAKHSNASSASVYIHEHPGFFQLLIADNGNNTPSNFDSIDRSGIGLTNMRDRVNALGGVINISNDSGFRIFVSIPKKK